MPAIDMPIEELMKYYGSSPLPKDFDKYWEKSLDEMNSVDPDIAMKKSCYTLPFADCFDFYFTGVGGARIYAKYLVPNALYNEPIGTVLVFHGYSGNSGDWFNLVPFVSAGFSVFAMDCRGQGGQSEDTSRVHGNTLHGHLIRGIEDSDELLFRSVFLDAAELAQIALQMLHTDKKSIYTTGCSQGGGLAIACAALVPQIGKIAAAFPFLSDYKRVWTMDLGENAYKEIKEYFQHFDPLHLKENSFFEKLGYIDIQNFANRIRGKVLMGTGLMDTICPASTQYAVYNKIISEKEMLVYPDYGHEQLPGFKDKILEFFLE